MKCIIIYMDDATGFALLGGFVLFSIFVIGFVCKFMEWLTDQEVEARNRRGEVGWKEYYDMKKRVEKEQK